MSTFIHFPRYFKTYHSGHGFRLRKLRPSFSHPALTNHTRETPTAVQDNCSKPALRTNTKPHSRRSHTRACTVGTCTSAGAPSTPPVTPWGLDRSGGRGGGSEGGPPFPPPPYSMRCRARHVTHVTRHHAVLPSSSPLSHLSPRIRTVFDVETGQICDSRPLVQVYISAAPDDHLLLA